MFTLSECGLKYVGSEMWEAIRAASVADHHLPKDGGIMDQSAWFIDAWIAFTNEKAKLENEQAKRQLDG